MWESWKDWHPLCWVPTYPTQQTTLQATLHTKFLTSLSFNIRCRLPYRLSPSTTLNKQPNLRLQGKETQEAYSCTCSTYTTITIWKRLPFSFHQLRWPSHFFIFTPLFISHMLKARFLHGLLNTFILICFKCLPSTLTFAVKQLFWTWRNRDHQRWHPSITCTKVN